MANRKLWQLALVMLMLTVLISIAAGCGDKNAGRDHNSNGYAQANKAMAWSKMPEMIIDLNHQYSATLHTNMGDFVIKLYEDEAPLTVNNFVFLAREGYYDGLSFNRIVEDFMIQSDESKISSAAGPGYVIPDELNTGFRYEAGVVAMANAGKPNSGGSQFFICVGPKADNLNQEPMYTIFGKVISGMDTVKRIAEAPLKNNEPIDKIIIESIVIHEA